MFRRKSVKPLTKEESRGTRQSGLIITEHHDAVIEKFYQKGTRVPLTEDTKRVDRLETQHSIIDCFMKGAYLALRAPIHRGVWSLPLETQQLLPTKIVAHFADGSRREYTLTTVEDHRHEI